MTEYDWKEKKFSPKIILAKIFYCGKEKGSTKRERKKKEKLLTAGNKSNSKEIGQFCGVTKI